MATGDKIMGYTVYGGGVQEDFQPIVASKYYYVCAPRVRVSTNSSTLKRPMAAYRRSGSSWIRVASWNTKDGSYLTHLTQGVGEEPLWRIGFEPVLAPYGSPVLSLTPYFGYGRTDEKIYYADIYTPSETFTASNYKANQGVSIKWFQFLGPSRVHMCV